MKQKEKALLFAEHAHHGQQYGLYPYTYHLKQVAEIAEEIGFDEDIVVACILHDIIEDTHLSYNDVKKEFGEDIAEIVYAVTDELGRNRKERHEKTYPKIKSNQKALAVKLCDKISNVREAKLSESSKLKMYKKEHLEFYTQLYFVSPSDELIENAWDKLVKSY